jgi:hypothetical protein
MTVWHKTYLHFKIARQMLCMVLVFFLCLQQGTLAVSSPISFLEPANKSIEEESRTEKDTENNQEEEHSQLGKFKKVRKLPLPKLTLLDFTSSIDTVFFFPIFVQYLLPYLPVYHYDKHIFLYLDRYLSFHSLIFYE